MNKIIPFAIIVLAMSSFAYADITTGLVGYWKFDENSGTVAADSSGHDNNGSLQGGVTWANGYTNSDLNFDGVNDDVNAGTNYILSGGAALTLSAWIKPFTSTGYIASKRDTSTCHMSWEFYLSSGKLKFGISTTAGPNPDVTLTSNGSINTSGSVWTHVAATYDNNVLKVYINGAQDPTTASRTGSIVTSPVCYTLIGALGNSGSPSTVFSGLIDDIRIYNRALTATDVNNLYKDTKIIIMGSNLDIRDGTLNVPSSYSLTAQTGKKILIRRTPTNTDQKLIIQRPGKLILRK